MSEEQILAILEDMDAALVREALALFLAEGAAQAPPQEETPEFANFAQALGFLKKNYDFAELDLFSTEADLVYVSTGGRRILLTDTFPENNPGAPQPGTLGRAADQHGAQRNVENAPKAGEVPGRFSRLEI